MAEAAEVHQTLRQYLDELEQQNPVEEPVHQQEQVSTTDPDLGNTFTYTLANGTEKTAVGVVTMHVAAFTPSTLSGYVYNAHGKLLAYAILCNHFPGQLSALRNLQNDIVTLLASRP